MLLAPILFQRAKMTAPDGAASFTIPGAVAELPRSRDFAATINPLPMPGVKVSPARQPP
jgi:hypothetical protein